MKLAPRCFKSLEHAATLRSCAMRHPIEPVGCLKMFRRLYWCLSADLRHLCWKSCRLWMMLRVSLIYQPASQCNRPSQAISSSSSKPLLLVGNSLAKLSFQTVSCVSSAPRSKTPILCESPGRHREGFMGDNWLALSAVTKSKR